MSKIVPVERISTLTVLAPDIGAFYRRFLLTIGRKLQYSKEIKICTVKRYLSDFYLNNIDDSKSYFEKIFT